VEGLAGKDAVLTWGRVTRPDVQRDGMAVFAGGQPIYFRHKVNRADDAADFVRTGPRLEYGTARRPPVVRNGRVSAPWIRGTSSSRSPRTEASMASRTWRPREAPSGSDRSRCTRARLQHVRAATAPQVGQRTPRVEEGVGRTTRGSPLAVRYAWYVRLMLCAFYAVIFLVCVYMVAPLHLHPEPPVRAATHPYLDVDVADWQG